MPSNSTRSQMVPMKEVAERLDLALATAYRAVARGEIPHIKIGRRLLVPRAAFERLLLSAEKNGAPEVQAS